MQTQYSVKWEGFYSNQMNLFNELRSRGRFVDVTLCSDNAQIQAHRLILSACSPYFRDIFMKNSDHHVIFYVNGVSSETLCSLVEFMYNGHVNVKEDALDSFIRFAKSLQITGLCDEFNPNSPNASENDCTSNGQHQVSNNTQQPLGSVARPIKSQAHRLDDDVTEVVEQQSQSVSIQQAAGTSSRPAHRHHKQRPHTLDVLSAASTCQSSASVTSSTQHDSSACIGDSMVPSKELSRKQTRCEYANNRMSPNVFDTETVRYGSIADDADGIVISSVKTANSCTSLDPLKSSQNGDKNGGQFGENKSTRDQDMETEEHNDTAHVPAVETIDPDLCHMSECDDYAICDGDVKVELKEHSLITLEAQFASSVMSHTESQQFPDSDNDLLRGFDEDDRTNENTSSEVKHLCKKKRGNTHSRSRVTEQTLGCPMCARKFSHANNLSNHMKMHQGMTSCVICGGIYSTMQNLRLHLRYKHALSEHEVQLMVPTLHRTRK